MNKRKLRTVVNLYKNGISVKICLAIIMEFLANEPDNLIKVDWFNKFYEEINK
jgi:hypothetical protein